MIYMYKKVYVGFTFPHHVGTNAGYQHIKDYLSYDYMINCDKMIMKLNRKAVLWRRAYHFISKSIWGFPIFPIHILKCILLGAFHNNLVYHFIHPENSFVNFRLYIRKGNKIVLTLHQPFEWYENRKWENRLKRADKLIILSSSEEDLFVKKYGREKVIFIPHGINTDFYHQDLSIKKEKMVLTVGNWLRDYSFANSVYKKLIEIDSEIQVVAVCSSELAGLIDRNDRITCLSGISDEQLRNLYQKCAVLFLPLIRYTANNALLEASACGCKILISSNFNDNAYIPQKFICTCLMDVDAATKKIVECMASNTDNRLSEYINEHYSWQVIARRVEAEIAKLY